MRSISFSGDGTRIVTGGGGDGKPGHATVWNAQTGAQVLELKGFKEWVHSVAFSPDGTRILTGEILPMMGARRVERVKAVECANRNGSARPDRIATNGGL